MMYGDYSDSSFYDTQHNVAKPMILTPHFATGRMLPRVSSHFNFRIEHGAFRAQSLRIPHEAAHKTVVSKLTAGRDVLFSGCLAGEIFCEKRRGKMVLELPLRTLQVSELIQLELTNDTDEEVRRVYPFFVGVWIP